MRSERTIRFDILPPAGTTFTTMGDTPAAWPVISPDGTRVVFSPAPPGERPRLWLRRFDVTEAAMLPGTEDAEFPFWSPDSMRVGFFAGAKLKTIDVTGINLLSDCRRPALSVARGGLESAWADPLYGGQISGLSLVNENGGGLTELTRLDSAAGETSHRWPSFLPDGRHFVNTVRGGGQGQGVYVGSLDGATRTRLTGDLSSLVVDPAG